MRIAKLSSNLSQVRKLVWIFPFFAGPVFSILPLPLARTFFVPFLERYCTFLMLAAAWAAILALVSRYYVPVKTPAAQASSRSSSKDKKEKNPSRIWNGVRIVTLLAAVVFVMTLLDILKSKVPPGIFYFAISLLASSALEKACRHKGYEELTVFFRLLWTGTAAYLSFLLTSLEWAREPALISLGIACMLTAIPLAEIVVRKSREFRERAPSGPQLKSFLSLYRSWLALILAAPLMPAELVYFNALERSYLAVFLAFPFIAKHLQPMKNFKTGGEVLESAETATKTACFVYVVVLCAVAIIQRYLAGAR